MAVIHIDGKSFDVDGSDNLLQACLSLGIDVPYFCYHPALGSVGSCRQCAVKQYDNEENYKAGRGRLVMSCMVAPTNDMYISVDDDEAKEFRKRIVEYLMTNHPHDCPTCEEGGHCHLQDMTYMSGHRQRRYRFTKRTHHNQELGVFINHEMNRCIACYRCVRFYKDYAGGTDFGVYASNNRVYFGRETDGQLQSEFSGNLTEVCPTGVFTDKTHSDRYNRKWDMQYAPSICHGCSAGCNISAGERYGELRRIENRYNHDVNGYFLCDKGRFGYGYVNRSDRPARPYQNQSGNKQELTADSALDLALQTLKGKKAIGVGSPAASLESNFALKRLVGSDNYSLGIGFAEQNLVDQAIQILKNQDLHQVSIAQIEKADAVFVLGEDITQTSSRIALAIRQAAKNKHKAMADALRTPSWLAEPVHRIGQENYSPVYLAGVKDSKLDDVAKVSVVANIEDIARLGFLVGEIIESFTDWESLNKPAITADQQMLDLAYDIAKDLITANRPLVVSGTSLMSKSILKAAAYVAQALTKKRQSLYQKIQPNHDFSVKAGIYLSLPAVNSAGLSLLGGHCIETILTKEFDIAIVLENDLSQFVQMDLLKVLADKTLIVLDHQTYDWHQQADLVLSLTAFAESDGTVVSAEGRAGRFFQSYDKKYYDPSSDIKDAWRWLYALNDKQPMAAHLDEVIDDLILACPDLSGIKAAAPTADYRITGLKIAREPRRYSGRTALRAPLSIHEPMQPKDLDTALTFSMEGYVGEQTPASVIPFAWSAGWNSPQAWNKYQDKVGGRLKGGDVGVRLFDGLPKLDHTYQSERLSIQDLPVTDLLEGVAKLVPIHQIFSTNPLISRSPVVASQIQPTSWYLNAEDAKLWQVKQGDLLSIKSSLGEIVLPVVLVDYLAEGCIGYPAGLVPLSVLSPSRVKSVENATSIYRAAYERSLDCLIKDDRNPLFKISRTVENIAAVGGL